MAGFSDELKARLPQLMMSILAAKQGGPQALGAFQGGAHQAQQQAMDRAQRQQVIDRQQQMADAQQRQSEAQQAAIEGRAQRDDTRADKAAQYQRLQSAIGTMDRFSAGQGETAMDPAAAENSILQRGAGLESAFGLPQGHLSSFVPNMAPAISARKKREAQKIYDRAETQYGAEAMAGDSITLQTDVFGPVKPSKLREMFSAPATTADGAPVPIATGKKTPPAPGSFEDYSTTTPDRKALIERDRTAYMGAGREPDTGMDQRMSELRLQSMMVQTQLAQQRLSDAQREAARGGGVKLSTGQQTDLSEMKLLSDQIASTLTSGAENKWAGVGGMYQGSIDAFMMSNFGRGSPQGAGTRARIGNIRGYIAKLRGGTSFTVQEQKLLDTYTPSIDETPQAIVVKMQQLQDFLVKKAESLLTVVSDTPASVVDSMRGNIAPMPSHESPAAVNPFRR